MKNLFNHLILQLRQLVRLIAMPSVTIQYPFVTRAVPGMSRIQLRLNLNDCTACQDCEKFCPVDAVKVKVSEGSSDISIPDAHSAQQIHIDYGKCIACGICVEVCEPEALKYEKAEFPVTIARENLTVGLVKAKALPGVLKR